MWQRCSYGQSGANCEAGAASGPHGFEAIGIADATFNPGGDVNICGDATTDGYTDWHLPTAKELHLLIDYSVPRITNGIPSGVPPINVSAFPNTAYYYYWTSTLFLGESISGIPVNGDHLYIVNFAMHNSSATLRLMAGGAYVRCVRSQI